jgi:hypothetical protein
MSDPSRGFDVITLGKEYAALLGCDGSAPYAGLEAAIQGLCKAHLIGRASLLAEIQSGRDARFRRELKALHRFFSAVLSWETAARRDV